MRKAGILLPITALPSEYGIGCFSKSAYDFVDWLSEAGQTYWQILPLCQTSYGDSPYQSPSSYAGNPYMISIKGLIDEGLLEKEEVENLDFGQNSEDIDYNKIYETRYALLRKAYKRHKGEEFFEAFKKKNEFWLEDYALFMAIKESNGGAVWQKWEKDIRSRLKDAIKSYRETLEKEVGFWEFVQFKFYEQWGKLKSYANEKGVFIIGDIPIYVSADSADVWANPNLFKLDEEGLPTEVAGCPPDGFSLKGQLWGNPIYRWDAHKKDGYSWWIKRLEHCFDMYDLLRIDHFRGFDEYYAIPYGNEDAVKGKWEKGPGIALFNKMTKKLGEKDVIAEDLGFITPSVKRLLKDSGFAGIKVLEFAFDLRDTGEKNDYLPHNYEENCVAYTGTHDNQTLVGWLSDLKWEETKLVREYLCDFFTPTEKLYKPLISTLLMSQAKICIVPIADYLGYDDKARINTPSTIGSNWRWRLKKDELSEKNAKEIYEMTKRYGRI